MTFQGERFAALQSRRQGPSSNRDGLTYELARVTAATNAFVSGELPDSVRTLIVINGLTIPQYGEWRAGPATPPAEDTADFVVPPASMLVMPVPRHRDTAAVSYYIAAESGSPIAAGDTGPTIVYGSELVFDPGVYSLTEASPAAILAELTAGNTLDTAVQSNAMTVDTAVRTVPSGTLADRRMIGIQNRGTATIFVGIHATDLLANGMGIEPGETAWLPLGSQNPINAVAAAGSHDVRVMQVS